MRRTISLVFLGFLTTVSAAGLPASAFAQNNQPRNLILFVPDGLRR